MNSGARRELRLQEVQRGHFIRVAYPSFTEIVKSAKTDNIKPTRGAPSASAAQSCSSAVIVEADSTHLFVSSELIPPLTARVDELTAAMAPRKARHFAKH